MNCHLSWVVLKAAGQRVMGMLEIPREPPRPCRCETNREGPACSRLTRGGRSPDRAILTTMGSLASRKIAFSPIRSSSAPSLVKSACRRAYLSTGSAAEEENSAAASDTRTRIPGASASALGMVCSAVLSIARERAGNDSAGTIMCPFCQLLPRPKRQLSGRGAGFRLRRYCQG